MLKVKTGNEAWIETLRYIEEHGEYFSPRGLKIKEVRNFSICITEPKKRLIYNPIRKMSLPYAFGELIWYLTGDNSLKTMEYYSKRMKNFSDDGWTLNSAYGYRIFGKHEQIGFNQFEEVISKLKNDKDTRQAIVHLHTPSNKVTKDEVCTLTLQFMIRNDKLEMFVNMRSNDIVWGFTYDMFNFTMIQELIANELGIEMGAYYHNAASMHIYEKDFYLIKVVNDLYDNLMIIDKKYNFEFALNGLTLNDERFHKLFENEKAYRLSDTYKKCKKEELDNETLNVMNDILYKYSLYRRFGTLVNIDYSNKFDLMFITQIAATDFSKTGQLPKLVIYEGCDAVGKTYQIDNIKDDKTLVLHFDKPEDGFEPLIYFQVALMPVKMILDRFYYSELVYSNVYDRPKIIGISDEIILEEILRYRNAEVNILCFRDIDVIGKRIYERYEDFDEKLFDNINTQYKNVANRKKREYKLI